jgi:hypothetical protein
MIIIGHQHMRGIARRMMHTCHLRDDQSRTTFSPRLVIGNQAIRHMAIMRHNRIMTRRNNTVLKG